MKIFLPILLLATLLPSVALLAQSGTATNKPLQSPDEFFLFKRGEQFTPHAQLNAYFEYLAANVPTTMRLEKYGLTNEGRPLQVAYFSSPENLARLEQIRVNNLRLAGLDEGTADLNNPIAIVWLSMSVHGNEPSGSECSPILAFQLATQTEPEVREWLKNTIVILDPALNPDGYDRYSHWNRQVSNLLYNPNPDAREHREPWPGGRPNHYYYDLNRDWAWATQVETQQRLVLYQRWLPHIHADLHEQSIDNPYYFAPAAEPMHDFITPWQRDFQTQIGKNHARYFDANGWLYFTKEVFDLFYPSYGDTYPMFNGAIGMTYEQAGNSSAGRSIINSFSDTLTLHDRIQHHLTTSRSTIEIASKNAAQVVDNFRNYYARSVVQPQGQYQAFVVRESNDPNKVNMLCRLLDRHQIRYGRLGAGASGVKAFDYRSGKESTVSLNPNDMIISAFQPKSTLLEVLFEPAPRLSDSLTYDITAWALPYAYGLDVYALKEKMGPRKPRDFYKAPEALLSTSPYAWCVRRSSIAESAFVSVLLQQGVKVRYATKPFTMVEHQFEAGTYVIVRADNRANSDGLDSLVRAAAVKTNVSLEAVFSGFASKGNDFGSETFMPVQQPKIGLVYGDDVDDNSFGHTWFFFEREIAYPVTALPVDKLQRVKLNDYNTLVFPNGSYNLTDRQMTILKDWVQAGGRIIAFDGGVKAFAGKDGFQLELKTESKKDTARVPKPYLAGEREGISDQLPGAVVKAKVDPTNPLAYGLGDQYFSLKINSDAYEMSDKLATAVYLDNDYQSYGFIGSRVKPRLKNTPIAAIQRMGQGQIVYFVDNPLFRSFWQEGKVLFSNALFF